MRKTLITLGAIACLVVGVGVAAATSGSSATATPAAIGGEPDLDHLRPGDGPNLLTEVLADLVDKGTITSAQSTAITDALEAAREARIAEMQAMREKIQGFLEDGQITQAELDQLPADNPLNQLSNLMDDGTITLEELRSLRGGFGPGRHHDFGRLDPAPDASAGTGG